MNIEIIAPDGASSLFPEGTPTSALQTASPLAQSPALSDAAAIAAPDASLAPPPPGGGYGRIAGAAQAAAMPWLSALANDPTPVWNSRLALFSQSTPMREAAGAMAGSMLDAGVSPAMAGLSADPDTGEWGLPRSLDDVTGSPRTAATWLGLYNTLLGLMETDPWTGVVLSDGDSPLNANIAKIAGHLSSAFVGDPDTGQGGAIPGYGQVLNQFGDPFSIRAAHDGMSGALFSGDPSDFNAAWAQARNPAEQAAARSAVAGDIKDRIQTGRILPGQLGAPRPQGRLATIFGPDNAQTMASQADDSINARLAGRTAIGPPARRRLCPPP